LLIAALASLSTVDSFDPDEEFEEDRDDREVLRADFAICFLPRVAGKTLEGCNGSRMNGVAQEQTCKGHRRF
jgi:hypothetical protein